MMTKQTFIIKYNYIINGFDPEKWNIEKHNSVYYHETVNDVKVNINNALRSYLKYSIS